MPQGRLGERLEEGIALLVEGRIEAAGSVSHDASTTIEDAQRASFSAGVPIAEVRGSFDAADAIDSGQLVDLELHLQLHVDDGQVRGQLFLGGRDPNPNDGTIPTSPSLGSF